MLNVAALRAEHLVRQILRLFLGAPRRRRPPSKTEVRPRSRHPRRHPLSTGHRRGAPTAASCVKASSSSEGAAVQPAAPSFGSGALLHRLGNGRQHGRRHDEGKGSRFLDLRAVRPRASMGKPWRRAFNLPGFQHQSGRRGGRPSRRACESTIAEDGWPQQTDEAAVQKRECQCSNRQNSSRPSTFIGT
jgi:hypothetical protein